jgi:hypothetical protein
MCARKATAQKVGLAEKRLADSRRRGDAKRAAEEGGGAKKRSPKNKATKS